MNALAIVFLGSCTLFTVSSALTVGGLKKCYEDEASSCHRKCSASAPGSSTSPLVQCYQNDKDKIYAQFIQCANKRGVPLSDSTECWPVKVDSPLQSSGASALLPAWQYLECMSTCMTSGDTCMPKCHGHAPANAAALEQCKQEVADAFRQKLFQCLLSGGK